MRFGNFAVCKNTENGAETEMYVSDLAIVNLVSCDDAYLFVVMSCSSGRVIEASSFQLFPNIHDLRRCRICNNTITAPGCSSLALLA